MEELKPRLLPGSPFGYHLVMQRVLLVIDDYGELLFLQTLLKKLGFDVDGIQNERGFEESYLALNPELIIATAKGKRVNGLEMADGLRRVRGFPKLILLAGGPFFEKLRGLQIENVDGILESPVATTGLLQTIARVGNLDETALLDKYRRFKATLSPGNEVDQQILKRDKVEAEEKIVVSGMPQPSPVTSGAIHMQPSILTPSEREERFAKTLAELEEPTIQIFDRERVHKFTKMIRATENPHSVEKLENERQEFVKALFKKAKRQG